MKSYILLENITFFANHGVFPQEKKVGNVFVVSIKIKVDFSKSCLSDELDDTVSYAAVYEDIKKEMSKPSKLLEHVAYRIIHSLKKKYKEIEEVEVKLSKRNPPVGGQMDYASVILID